MDAVLGIISYEGVSATDRATEPVFLKATPANLLAVHQASFSRSHGFDKFYQQGEALRVGSLLF